MPSEMENLFCLSDRRIKTHLAGPPAAASIHYLKRHMDDRSIVRHIHSRIEAQPWAKEPLALQLRSDAGALNITMPYGPSSQLLLAIQCYERGGIELIGFYGDYTDRMEGNPFFLSVHLVKMGNVLARTPEYRIAGVYLTNIGDQMQQALVAAALSDPVYANLYELYQMANTTRPLPEDDRFTA